MPLNVALLLATVAANLTVVVRASVGAYRIIDDRTLILSFLVTDKWFYFRVSTNPISPRPRAYVILKDCKVSCLRFIASFAPA